MTERINLSDVWQEIGKVEEIELAPGPECLRTEEGEAESLQGGSGDDRAVEDGAATSLPDGGSACQAAEIEPFVLTITNAGRGKAVVSGRTAVYAEYPCDRCLKPVGTRIDISFDREVWAPELLEQDPEREQDQSFVDGYQLKPAALLQEEILMSRPVKILCKDDCKGICAVCGQDLNEGECGCDTFVPDPRMAVIADLFKQ